VIWCGRPEDIAVSPHNLGGHPIRFQRKAKLWANHPKTKKENMKKLFMALGLIGLLAGCARIGRQQTIRTK